MELDLAVDAHLPEEGGEVLGQLCLPDRALDEVLVVKMRMEVRRSCLSASAASPLLHTAMRLAILHNRDWRLRIRKWLSHRRRSKIGAAKGTRRSASVRARCRRAFRLQPLAVRLLCWIECHQRLPRSRGATVLLPLLSPALRSRVGGRPGRQSLRQGLGLLIGLLAWRLFTPLLE